MRLDALTPKQEEWSHWHERLNHLLYQKMRKLSDDVILPAHFKPLHSLPMCPSCAFGSSHQRAWIMKDSHDHTKKDKYTHAQPGYIVSINHLISAQLGLTSQSTGYLTASRTQACQVFIDTFSSCGYGFMM